MKDDSSIFKSLTKEEYHLLNSFLKIADDALKLNAKQKLNTLKAIRKLFFSLTSQRNEKKINYLNNPSYISAYIYYYLMWNLYRLVSLLNTLPIDLKDGNVIGDFGCGPLTFLLALWISKPQLRKKELTFYCVDISSKVIKIGEELFYSLIDFASRDFGTKSNKKSENKNGQILTKTKIPKTMWKIRKITGEFGLSLNEKLDFFVSCNMFNELCWDLNESKIIKKGAIVNSYLKEEAKVLIVEPGLPIGGKIISSFRSSFLKSGFNIISPCPHAHICPIHTKHTKEREGTITSKKWCHFVFSTAKAPSNLLELSENVHLAKKTVALSFIYCQKERFKNDKSVKSKNGNDSISCIITSNIIRLPNNRIGRYACSSLGFLLLWEEDEQKISLLKNKKSGSYLEIPSSKIGKNVKDKKSGATSIRI